MYKKWSNINDVNLKKPPLDERIRLVEDLWDSIATEQNALPLTTELQAEPDRRLDACEADGNPGLHAENVVANIRKRL